MRKVVIGEGIPKICIPIVEQTEEAILKAAQECLALPADMFEWRADWFLDGMDGGKSRKVLKSLRYILGEKPLLYTFRTREEGGEQEIDRDRYVELLQEVLDSGSIDLMDAEYATLLKRGKRENVQKTVQMIQSHGGKAVLSSHDFERTPDKQEMVDRLKAMEETGADMVKLAVMPRCKKDVLTLLEATAQVCETAKVPVITMSMDGMGLISRLCGEFFGSAVTFGAGKKGSAPGQMKAGELRNILESIHHCI